MSWSEFRGGVRLRNSSRTAILLLIAMLLFARACAWAAEPASPEQQAIRKVYVDNFQGKFGSADLRQKVVDRLRSSGKWQLVNTAAEADATVRGAGELWVKGYLSNSPHAATSQRQPVYGGYLSLQLQNKGGETIWSYLVTPARLHWSGVDQDMVDRIVHRLTAELERGAESNTRAAAAPSQSVTLAGAGATFPAPLYQEWIQSFSEAHPEIRTTYQAVGSEEGIRMLKDGKVDFAASDVPLSDEQMAGMQLKVANVATVLGGVVPAYNLPGVGPDLRFTPAVLAEIYLGKITKWNDPQLRALNHGLPDLPIVVVHRSDGSGTTYTWTSFLSATSPEWKSAVGAGMRVQWPTGEAAQGNDGVSDKVAKTPGAIGYMELTWAIRNELAYGLVKNAAGRFVQANLASLSAAATATPEKGDLRAPLVNAPGGNAWPITTFTWILAPVAAGDPQKSAALDALLHWMLTAGQKESAGLGYQPLPKEIADRELQRTVAAALR